MGASSSTTSSIDVNAKDAALPNIPDGHPSTDANATPPPGCPMHQQKNPIPPANASECPMNAENVKEKPRIFYPSECPMHAENKENKENADAINPLNLVRLGISTFLCSFPIQLLNKYEYIADRDRLTLV